jgi:hypothetical protein
MSRLFAALVLILGFQAAQATSLNPCTPTVEAQPTLIMCQSGAGESVRIEVKTLMSPATPACSGENRYEYKTASVEIYAGSKTPKAKFDIADGDFSYTLSPMGDATFESPKHSLNLNKCVTPLNGGVSFGN